MSEIAESIIFKLDSRLGLLEVHLNSEVGLARLLIDQLSLSIDNLTQQRLYGFLGVLFCEVVKEVLDVAHVERTETLHYDEVQQISQSKKPNELCPHRAAMSVSDVIREAQLLESFALLVGCLLLSVIAVQISKNRRTQLLNDVLQSHFALLMQLL